jgi:hypothetical protein
VPAEPKWGYVHRGRDHGNVRRDLAPEILAELVVGILNTALLGWLNDASSPLTERLTSFADVIGELISPRASRTR